MVLTLLDLVKRKPVLNAPSDQVFWLHDGYQIANLRELRDALATMTKRQFEHHVNAEKNDFATWVRDVLADDVLADDLHAATTRKEARAVLEQHLLDWYESRRHA